MNAKATIIKSRSEKAQELQEKLYLAAKKSKTRILVLLVECTRKKVIWKPYEGELHVRFDEGELVKTIVETCSLLYNIRTIRCLTTNITNRRINEYFRERKIISEKIKYY